MGARPFVVALAPSIQPLLHRLEHRFVFPARNAPIVARRAARFERTPGAGRGPVLAQGHTALDRGKALDSPLARGTAILIVRGDINKVLLVEAAVGQAVGGQRLGHARASRSCNATRPGSPQSK